MNTIYENNIKWESHTGYVYKLLNTEDQKWYIGSGKGNPEDPEKPYITSSKNPKLLLAIAEGKIKRHIISFDDLEQSRISEAEILDKTNAANDPMSYNESNFTGTKQRKLSNVDEAEEIALERVKKLFNCNYANLQPHSGSQANQAVYLALLKPHDTILGMSIASGGHLTHGAKPNLSGKWFNSIQYGVKQDGNNKDLIDYE